MTPSRRRPARKGLAVLATATALVAAAVGAALPARTASGQDRWPGTSGAAAPAPPLRLDGGSGVLRAPAAGGAPLEGPALGLMLEGGGARPFLALPVAPAIDLSVREAPVPGAPAAAAGLALRLVEERGRRPAVAAGVEVSPIADGAASGGWGALGRDVGPLRLGLGLAYGPWRNGTPTAGADPALSAFASAEASLLRGRLRLQAAVPPGLAGANRFPVDLGATARLLPWLDLGIARQADGDWLLRLGLHPDGTPGGFRPAPPPAPPIVAARGRLPTDPTRPSSDPGRVEATVAAALRDTGLAAEAVRVDGTVAEVWLEPAPGEPAARAAGRAARALTGLSPDTVRRFRLTLGRHGLDLTRIDLWRHELEAAGRHSGSTAELWHGGEIAPADGTAPAVRRPTPALTFDLASRLTLAIDDPTLDRAHEADLTLSSLWRPAPRLVIGGGVRAIADAGAVPRPAGATPAAAAGVLPPVRSDLFGRHAPLRVDGLWVGRLWRPSPSMVLRGAAGWLEEDLAGLTGAALWHPFRARWAIEAEATAGFRRSPATQLRLLPETRASALLDLHWQPPVDGLDLTVGGGRYLAGDWGIEAGLTRRFAGGVSVGAAAGWSFGRARDPAGTGREPAGVIGLRLDVPLQTLAPPSLRDRLSVSQVFALGPLTRDAGQRPAVPLDLSELTAPVGFEAVGRTWGQLLD